MPFYWDLNSKWWQDSEGHVFLSVQRRFNLWRSIYLSDRAVRPAEVFSHGVSERTELTMTTLRILVVTTDTCIHRLEKIERYMCDGTYLSWLGSRDPTRDGNLYILYHIHVQSGLFRKTKAKWFHVTIIQCNLNQKNEKLHQQEHKL